MNKLPTHFKYLLLPLSSSSSILPIASQIYVAQSKRTSEKSVFVLADFPYPLKNIKREEMEEGMRRERDQGANIEKVGRSEREGGGRKGIELEKKGMQDEKEGGTIKEKEARIREGEEEGGSKFSSEERRSKLEREERRELGQWEGGMLEQVQLEKKLNVQEIEHFLTRTLKDFMVRYKILKGYKVKYVIGVDLYGKEIEERAMKEALVKLYF